MILAPTESTGLIAELGRLVSDGIDPPDAIWRGEADVVDYVRRLLANEIWDQVPRPIRDGLPPLYTPDGDGGWTFHGEDYTPEEMRSWALQEVKRCKRNLVHFATTYCYTLNGSLFDTTGKLARPELVPDWPYVRATLTELHTPSDVLIEKSRDMMASWLCMLTVLSDLLFRPTWSVMTASRLENLVDDGGAASTFITLHGKVRFIYARLPPFLRDSTTLIFRHLHILNPVTESLCLGFAATMDAGRAGKFKRAIMDEFAMLEHSEEVMAAITNACPVGKVLNSTPRGMHNAFYRIREASRGVWPVLEQKAGHWKRLTLHWSQHPERDQAWYDTLAASGSMTEQKLAAEQDISYAHSLGHRVYPKFVRDLHVSGGALCDTPTAYVPMRPLYVCMDFNRDPFIWVLVQVYAMPPLFRVIGEICRRDATHEDMVLEFVIRFGNRQRVDFLLAKSPDWRDLYGRRGICQAGSDGHQQDVVLHGDATENKETVYGNTKMYGMIHAALQGHGFRVKMAVPPQNPPIMHRIETVNDVLSRKYIAIDPSAEQVIRDFESGVWNRQQTDMNQLALDDDGSGLTRSHASSALGYFLVLKHKVATTAQKAVARARTQNVAAMIRKW